MNIKLKKTKKSKKKCYCCNGRGCVPVPEIRGMETCPICHGTGNLPNV